jgi:hypothetical protein
MARVTQERLALSDNGHASSKNAARREKMRRVEKKSAGF